MTVKTNKTKIIHFRNAGKNTDTKIFLDKREIEIVSSYIYFGIPVSSSSLGLLAANEAMKKTKITTGCMLSTLANSKTNSWHSMIKLFNLVTTATFLYAAPIWSLRYTEILEKAQLDYFKRLRRLPVNTQNVSLRLELNLYKIDLKICELTIDIIIYLLKLPEDRH